MVSAETTGAAQLLARSRDGVLLYGLTPPRGTTSPEQADAVAESARSSTPRPFPFMPMMDPAVFLDRHLAGWAGPVVVYRAVGKYTGDELGEWLSEADRDRVLTVLVGAASRRQVVRTSLPEAYRRRAGLARPPRMGGVVIAERHADAGTEHERMLRK